MPQSITTPVRSASTWGHWGRMAICVLTMGFAFPHSSTEGMDEPVAPVKPRLR